MLEYDVVPVAEIADVSNAYLIGKGRSCFLFVINKNIMDGVAGLLVINKNGL